MQTHRAHRAAFFAAAMIVLVVCPKGVAAQVADDTHWACISDAFRLCSEFIPNEAQITQCMTVKIAQVSPKCQAAMEREDRIRKARKRAVSQN
jgi:uncharacterized membrane protein